MILNDNIDLIELTNSRISKSKQEKLIKSLPKYLKSKEKALQEEYGENKTQVIIKVAKQVYPEIVKIIAVGNEAMVKWATAYYIQPGLIMK